MDGYTVLMPHRRDVLGEGPFWHGAAQALYWVDIVSRRISRLAADGGVTDWLMPEPVSAAIPTRDDRLVVALASRLVFLDPASGALTDFCAPDAAFPGNRANEARCDPQGRLWLGTMGNNIGPDGAAIPLPGYVGNLYCITPQGQVTRWAEGVGVSNTLGWSPDGGTLYFADSERLCLYAYDFDGSAGTLSHKRVFAEAFGPGFPDGSSVDAEGCIWNARWEGQCLIRLRPDGSVDRKIDMPMRRPTSCCFGGPDLKTLYITSAYHGMTDAERAADPLSGALLAMSVDVPGLPLPVFG